jgi:hypothetical protein
MISYPLTIPGPVYPSQADLKQFDAIGEVISPFAGTAEQQQFQDQHWELDLDWPEMTWAQFAALQAFTASLHGKLGSFVWGPPLATGPRGVGTMGGIPTCVGTDLSGSNTLTTQAWIPYTIGLLLPGDFLSIGPPSVDFVAFTNEPGVVTLVLLGALPSWLTVGSQIWVTPAPGALAPFIDQFAGGPFVVTAAQNAGAGGANGAQVSYDLAGVTSGTESAPGTISGGVPPRLYQYMNAAGLNSNGGGGASIDIFPSLREAPTAGAPVILINPQGSFRLADNRRSAPAKKTKTFSLSLKCREAI